MHGSRIGGTSLPTGDEVDPAVFRGRVLFVNDINVTGTQQSFMQQAFEDVGPASVDWLYIIQVDPASAARIQNWSTR